MGKVVFPFVWRAGGGSVESASILAAGLVKRGRAVVALTPTNADDIKQRFVPYGVSSESYTSRTNEPFDAVLSPWSVIRGIWKGAFSQLGLSLDAMRTLRRMRPALVYINDDSSLLAWAVPAKLLGIPVIWHLRSRRSGVRDWLRLRCVDVVIPISHYVSERIRSKKVTSPIYNPVDIGRLQSDAAVTPTDVSKCRLLCISRDVALKRTEWAVHVVWALYEEGHDVTLDIVGPFSEARQRELVACVSQEVRERIRFRGRVPSVASFIHEADIVIHPAIGEGFGRVLIEAGACAKPVAAIRNGGPAEIIVDGENGLLADNDLDNFVAKVRYLVTHEKVRGRVGNRAQVVAESFNVATHCRMVDDVIARVIGD